MLFLIITAILQWAVIVYFLTKKILNYRWIEIRFRQTFFGKVKYGVSLLLCKALSEYSSIGRSIVTFYWNNEENLGDSTGSKPKSLWAPVRKLKISLH